MSECRNLTDASITAIAEHCAALTSLRVFGCPNLTAASCTALQERLPACDVDVQELP